MFADLVSELTSTLNKPLFTYVTVPSYGQYLDLDVAYKLGLVNPPPMELFLVAYLTPFHNQGMGSHATLQSKHCRISGSELDKIY